MAWQLKAWVKPSKRQQRHGKSVHDGAMEWRSSTVRNKGCAGTVPHGIAKHRQIRLGYRTGKANLGKQRMSRIGGENQYGAKANNCLTVIGDTLHWQDGTYQCDGKAKICLYSIGKAQQSK